MGGSRPLTSLGVLDFSFLVPGPFATMMLADLGADVIRIESPARPDLVRQLEPMVAGTSAWHRVLGRSKRSLSLDLTRDGASAVVERLLRTHDIVLVQTRPGVMDRFGLGYDDLRRQNPAVIYCTLSSFGPVGPRRGDATHDLNALALSGILSYGGPEGCETGLFGVPVADLATAMNAVTGILAAVIQRTHTGEGQAVDVSLADSALAWSAFRSAEHLAAGAEPAWGEGLLTGGSAYGIYSTADGRLLSVGSLEPRFWQRFCDLIGCPDLAVGGHSVATDPHRARRRVAEAVAGRTLAEWTAIFREEDICVEPVLTASEALDDPSVDERGMIAHVPDGSGGFERQVGCPVRFGGSAPAYRHVGAEAGRDRDEILSSIGYSRAEIGAMARSGLFG